MPMILYILKKITFFLGFLFFLKSNCLLFTNKIEFFLKSVYDDQKGIRLLMHVAESERGFYSNLIVISP